MDGVDSYMVSSVCMDCGDCGWGVVVNPSDSCSDGDPVATWDGLVIPCCAFRMNVLSFAASAGWLDIWGWVRMNWSSSKVRDGRYLIAGFMMCGVWCVQGCSVS